MSTNLVSLGKWISSQGVASRRKSVELIEQGKVKVGGRVIKQPFFRFDPTQTVTVNGQVITQSTVKEYYLVYKPSGYVSSTTVDEKGRPPVTRLVPSRQRLYPVGRLDIDSEGLMLLTNDGDTTYELTHPKFAVEKEYKVLVSGELSARKIDQLESGIHLKEGKTLPAKIVVGKRQGKKNWVSITIREGKFHQIRRMCSRVSLEVERLIRVKEGPLSLGDLKPGQWQKISKP